MKLCASLALALGIALLTPLASRAQTVTPQRLNTLPPELNGSDFMNCNFANSPLGQDEAFLIDANNLTPGSYGERVNCSDIWRAFMPYNYVTMTSGGSYTVPTGSKYIDLHATSTILSYTVVLPAILDRWEIEVVSDVQINSFALTPVGSGTTVVNPPASLAPFTPMKWQYVLTTGPNGSGSSVNQWRPR
jgi:hypothetical protein